MSAATMSVDALPARIASKIAFAGDDCWPWMAYRKASGYGVAWWGGRTMPAHRAVYEILVGPIPEGLEIDHTCRNRACVNPSHMKPVTKAENDQRGLLGYALRTRCRSGQHDITDPANVYIRPSNGARRCHPCKKARDTPRTVNPKEES